VLSRPSSLLDRRLPLHCGQSLHPAPASHRAGLCLTRHQRGFTQFTRPVFPSPAAARMERAAASAFPRASHPADQEPATHARVGTGQRARTWNYTLNITFGLILQSCSSLTTCDLASHGYLQQSRPTGSDRWTLLAWNESRHLGVATSDSGDTPQFVPLRQSAEPDRGLLLCLRRLQRTCKHRRRRMRGFRALQSARPIGARFASRRESRCAHSRPSWSFASAWSAGAGLWSRAGHQAADHRHGPAGCDVGARQPIRSARETMIPSGPRT